MNCTTSVLVRLKLKIRTIREYIDSSFLLIVKIKYYIFSHTSKKRMCDNNSGVGRVHKHVSITKI